MAKKTPTPAKKAPTKKTPAKQAPVKKAPEKKAPVKKAPAKKAPVKAPEKKIPVTAPRRPPERKAPAPKVTVKDITPKLRSELGMPPSTVSSLPVTQQNPRLTHAVLVTEVDQAIILRNPMNWPTYHLGIAAPVFPVASLAEMVENEGICVSASNLRDIHVGTVLSPRFLSGCKIIPVNRIHRLAALAENKPVDERIMPAEDELYLYMQHQTDEVVFNAMRVIFISLDHITEHVPAYVLDRVNGLVTVIGSLSIEKLMSREGGMRAVKLPESLVITIDKLNQYPKALEQGFLDEPVPFFRRLPRKSSAELVSDTFVKWDAELGQFLDSYEIAHRFDKKPFSGAARIAMRGWENGHPKESTVDEVMDHRSPELRERVCNHLSKCLVCAHSALIRAVPVLDLSVPYDEPDDLEEAGCI